MGGKPLLFIDPEGLRSVLSFGVSVAAQFGITPPALGIGANASGGTSLGLSIPDDWTNLKCYQIVLQVNAYGGAGIGSYVGVGIGGGYSSLGSDKPLPRVSTSNSVSGNANVGWAISWCIIWN